MIEFKLTSITKEWVNTFCLLMITCILGASAFQYTRGIMIPFLLSLLIAFAVLPFIDFLQQKCKIPRLVSIFITFALVVAGLTLITLIMISNVRVFVDNLATYRAQFYEALTQVIDQMNSFGIKVRRENIIDSLDRINFFNYLGTSASKLFSFAMNVFLVITFIFFLLTGKPQNLPKSGMWAKLSHSVRTYLVTKTITSFVTGFLTGVILSFMGLNMAFMFGFLAFILNFIPTFGSIVAVLLPIPIAMLQFDSALMIILTVAIPGTVQFLIGSLIEPFYIGDALDLHPVTILLALMFWGLMWGVPGAILATPICVIIRICLNEFDSSKPFAELMAGRIPQITSKDQQDPSN